MTSLSPPCRVHQAWDYPRLSIRIPKMPTHDIRNLMINIWFFQISNTSTKSWDLGVVGTVSDRTGCAFASLGSLRQTEMFEHFHVDWVDIACLVPMFRAIWFCFCDPANSSDHFSPTFSYDIVLFRSRHHCLYNYTPPQPVESSLFLLRGFDLLSLHYPMRSQKLYVRVRVDSKPRRSRLSSRIQLNLSCSQD